MEKFILYEILAILLIIIPFWYLYPKYQNLTIIPSSIYFYCIDSNYKLLKPKIYFMYLPYFKPLFDYQKQLLQNCDSIEEADYLVMGGNSYFRGKGYFSLKWNETFTKLVFSKKIIMIAEEDITINKRSFNFTFIDKITAVIGCNEVSDLKNFFKIPNVFSHLIFGMYTENHQTSYSNYVNRRFYIQSAISNIYYCVNSNRRRYLRACMDSFGSKKVANYGALYHNQNYPSNSMFKKLPSNSYFGFAMENSIADFWITEKLFFTYRNDAVPIYRGGQKNSEILKSFGINTKAFIDASNMSVDELVKCLKKLIKGKKKLYEIYKQPLIPDRKLFDQKIIDNFRKILDVLENQQNTV